MKTIAGFFCYASDLQDRGTAAPKFCDINWRILVYLRACLLSMGIFTTICVSQKKTDFIHFLHSNTDACINIKKAYQSNSRWNNKFKGWRGHQLINWTIFCFNRFISVIEIDIFALLKSLILVNFWYFLTLCRIN